jgi:hypothetical protein
LLEEFFLIGFMDKSRTRNYPKEPKWADTTEGGWEAYDKKRNMLVPLCVKSLTRE